MLDFISSKQVILSAFLVALCSTLGYAQQGTPAQFRTAVEQVVLYASVYDKDTTLVADLKKEDFTIFEDKIQQEITYFGRMTSHQRSGSSSIPVEACEINSIWSMRPLGFFSPRTILKMNCFSWPSRAKLGWNKTSLEMSKTSTMPWITSSSQEARPCTMPFIWRWIRSCGGTNRRKP